MQTYKRKEKCYNISLGQGQFGSNEIPQQLTSSTLTSRQTQVGSDVVVVTGVGELVDVVSHQLSLRGNITEWMNDL